MQPLNAVVSADHKMDTMNCYLPSVREEREAVGRVCDTATAP